MKKRKRSSSAKERPDLLLLLSAAALSLFGVLMVYDASVVEAFRSFSDKFHFARLQLLWSLIGLGFMLLVSQLPYKVFKKLSLWAFSANLVLLALVLIPSVGTKVMGARRWIVISGITIQPAELIKLTFTMYLAAYLSEKRRFYSFLLLASLVVGLVMLQPDFGTAAVIGAIASTLYFFSGANLIAIAGLLFISLLAGSVFIATSEYRKARILTFLNPQEDPLGASYHIRQVLIALGSGGLFGLGLGKSRQKFEYIPAATTDSIFAIVAEELGFFGASALIIFYLVFLTRAFKIAKNAPDKFSTLLASGIAAWIGIQTVINLGTMVALIPLTGVPLPFISYGGSATIVSLTATGILLNISRHAKT